MHNQTYEITVNAQEKIVTSPRVTFEQIVLLAFPNNPPDASAEFSMTYRHAASKPPAGELAAGGTIEVKKEGTVFNVTRTIKS